MKDRFETVPTLANIVALFIEAALKGIPVSLIRTSPEKVCIYFHESATISDLKSTKVRMAVLGYELLSNSDIDYSMEYVYKEGE